MSARVCPDGAGSRASTRLAATRTPAAATAPAGTGLYSNTTTRALPPPPPPPPPVFLCSVLSPTALLICLCEIFCTMHGSLLCSLSLLYFPSPELALIRPCLLCACLTCMSMSRVHMLISACACVVRRGAAIPAPAPTAGPAHNVTTNQLLGLRRWPRTSRVSPRRGSRSSRTLCRKVRDCRHLVRFTYAPYLWERAHL
eukprot:COSAG05_NODE_3126_length_2304_cov_2.452608_2_plen_199_part_00